MHCQIYFFLWLTFTLIRHSWKKIEAEHFLTPSEVEKYCLTANIFVTEPLSLYLYVTYSCTINLPFSRKVFLSFSSVVFVLVQHWFSLSCNTQNVFITFSWTGSMGCQVMTATHSTQSPCGTSDFSDNLWTLGSQPNKIQHFREYPAYVYIMNRIQKLH